VWICTSDIGADLGPDENKQKNKKSESQSATDFCGRKKGEHSAKQWSVLLAEMREQL
jgi:hypothetical protein